MGFDLCVLWVNVIVIMGFNGVGKLMFVFIFVGLILEYVGEV